MSTLLEQVHRLLQADRPLCYTALVETNRSTRRKAGATMLVFRDGTQLGTLGDSVEPEVKERVLRLLFDLERIPLNDLATERLSADPLRQGLLTFQLDPTEETNDGPIDAGRISILVDPVFPGDDLAYFHQLHEELDAGRGCTEAIVLDPFKAGGGTEGDRLLIDQRGLIVATRQTAGLSLVPSQVSLHLKPVAERPRPYVAGGISFLPHLQRCRLIIIGAGQVGEKVASLASEVDFDVWVVDDTSDNCRHERFPTAKKLIVHSFETAFSPLNIDGDTYCIIVTRGHHQDQLACQHLAESSARYVGMIGSRQKIKRIFEALIKEGVSREALVRVSAPLGVDIGSQTVEEIAISIVAELIAHRNLGSQSQQVRRVSLLDNDA